MISLTQRFEQNEFIHRCLLHLCRQDSGCFHRIKYACDWKILRIFPKVIKKKIVGFIGLFKFYFDSKKPLRDLRL